MKKKHITSLSFFLSLLMLLSTVLPSATAGWRASTIGRAALDSNAQPVATQSLASVNDYITGSAASTFDLSQSGKVSLTGAYDITCTYNTAGYYTFTAKANDPYVYLSNGTSFSSGRYVLITYRASDITNGYLQFYIGSSGGGPQNDSTMMKQAIVADGTWRVAAFDTSTIPSTLYNGTTATYFRLDPIDGATVSGCSIDISSIAFYAADAFDYDGYQTYLDSITNRVEWSDPVYVAQTYTSADYNDGTLTYTPSADGANMTISYDLNGTTVSGTVPNQNNYLFGGFAGTDDLGRELYSSEDVGIYGSTGEHYVGLFYFLWHGQHGATDTIYNLQKIIDSGKGTDAGQYAAVGSEVLHWFAEPLYGYYISGDTWVMRKHAELLCNANVDFLYLDATNGFTYTSQTIALMAILHEFNEQGYDAPQIVFYTNSASNTTVQTLYNEIYAVNYYPDTWFRLDGKPVMVATESSDSIRTSGTIPTALHNFFCFKESQWPNESAKKNGWPWMDWSTSYQTVYSATDGREAISVSIAQHNSNICFSSSAMHGYAYNQGRSYAPGRYSSMTNYRNTWQNDQDLTKWGYNFQWQWDTAINSNAEFVLVTGWNEWVAQRQNSSITGNKYSIVFIDCASMEFSRDAEMMAYYDRDGDGEDDGYFDNYYMQLTQNIERLKGDAPVIVQDKRKPINVTAGFNQWDDITVTYTDVRGDTANRSSVGYGNSVYVNTTGRNDILKAKVTSDSKNVYFYAQTRYDVSMFDTYSSWMQLFVDADNNAATGWYGYDYIVNYRAQDQFTTTVAKYSGSNNAFSFTTVGTVGYRAKNNEIMIAVPQSMLGMDGYLELDFAFKWADSTSNITTMQQFYTDGDAAPLGRLNYVYQNYIPGKSVVNYPSDVTTETETEPKTETETSDGSSSTPSYEAPADNSVPVQATGSNYQTCTDYVYINGSIVAAVNDGINTYRQSPIVDRNESINTIAFYGWTNTEAHNIAAFGYEINGEQVWDTSKINSYTVGNGSGGTVTLTASNCSNNIAPDSALSTVYTYGKRAMVEVNAGALPAGVYNISILIKLTDGSVYYLETWGTFQFVKWGLVENTTESEIETETETETEITTEPETETETETEAETVSEDRLMGASVSIGENLSMKVYASIVNPTPDGGTWAVQITMNGAISTRQLNQAIFDTASGYYTFTFDGITPQCMGDSMTISLVPWDNWTGEPFGSPVHTHTEYSVKSNLANLLSTYASDGYLVQLLYDTITYGAAAQTYTGYRTDALVNADLEALIDAAVGTDWTPTQVMPTAADNVLDLSESTHATVRFRTASVLFDTGVNRLVFFFDADDTVVTAVTVNGTAVPVTRYADGLYTVQTEAVSATEFDKVYTAELLVDGTTVQTLTYSVNTYAYRTCKDDSTTSVGEALTLALYRYGVAAKAYAAA